ncbi:hypothetical protein [Halobacterium sp. CBA1126]|uniref:hypothetical protein n=1 Tax=Halobacterium sp. CBA1126 TaxID=2668074 RepID=UPI0012F9C5CE|nr:hypothetical protein [Halobacterium sp. CBA1126]MUV59798.1 hypothetical protein [Halobacterium sp. CBA1126]
MSSSAGLPQNDSGSGCPVCGAGVQHIETQGPGEVRAQPCGHAIGHISVRNILGGDQP